MKLLIRIFILAIVVTFTSCSSENNTNADAPTTNQESNKDTQNGKSSAEVQDETTAKTTVHPKVKVMQVKDGKMVPRKANTPTQKDQLQEAKKIPQKTNGKTTDEVIKSLMKKKTSLNQTKPQSAQPEQIKKK